MRSCSCARRPTDAHMSSRTHPRTPYVYTPMYAHVCTYTRTRENCSDIKICSTALSNRVPSSVRHHSLLLSNHCTIRIHIGTTLAAQSVQTVSICHLFSTNLPFISNYLPTIHQLFINLSLISHLLSLPPINSHISYSICIWFQVQPTHHHINMSVCYKTLAILYILADFSSAFSSTTVSHLIQITTNICLSDSL